MKAIVTLKNVSKSFNNNTILNDISLKLYPRESVVLIGLSGVGKSVLAKLIMGIESPSKGKIYIADEDVSNKSITDRLNLNFNIGILFQQNALFDSLTTFDNIAFSLNHSTNKYTKEYIYKLVCKNLSLVELPKSILKQYPSSLSGGMQKRVALARVLTQSPNMIIFDEPTTGLDPITGNKISILIKNIRNYLDITAFSISHDMNYVNSVANKVLFLHNKQITWQGTCEDMKKINKNNILYDFTQNNRNY